MRSRSRHLGGSHSHDNDAHGRGGVVVYVEVVAEHGTEKLQVMREVRSVKYILLLRVYTFILTRSARL